MRKWSPSVTKSVLGLKEPGYPQLLIALTDRLHCVCLYLLQKHNEITSEFYQVREDSQIDFATGNVFFARFSQTPTPHPPCLETFQPKIDNQFKMCALVDVDDAQNRA